MSDSTMRHLAPPKSKRQAPIISITAKVGRRYVAYLESMLEKAVAMIPRCPREMSVVLVNDQAMSQLHEQFMGIGGPTDVLTFELDHDTGGRVVSGEIVICVPVARRRCLQLKHRIEDELLLYALHGVLHMSGYDDKNDAAYEKMHRTEDRILKRLGIGAIFATCS